MTEDRYDDMIQPYIDEAFSRVDWPNSFAGRLLLASKTYRECVGQLEAETGHANPRRVGPDMLRLIHQYVEPLS